MKKLAPGMHIRIVSPSSSIERLGGFEANLAAKERLAKLGFTVSFSEHYLENDMLGSASIESRVADIHAAFSDDSVDAILATIGGFNCNELLPYLDFELIARNPKIFCGYSDTTALLSAIYSKTGMKTIWIKQGFSRLAQVKNLEEGADWTVEKLTDLLPILLS